MNHREQVTAREAFKNFTDTEFLAGALTALSAAAIYGTAAPAFTSPLNGPVVFTVASKFAVDNKWTLT